MNRNIMAGIGAYLAMVVFYSMIIFISGQGCEPICWGADTDCSDIEGICAGAADCRAKQAPRDSGLPERGPEAGR